jgi:hypothetical protein
MKNTINAETFGKRLIKFQTSNFNLNFDFGFGIKPMESSDLERIILGSAGTFRTVFYSASVEKADSKMLQFEKRYTGEISPTGKKKWKRGKANPFYGKLVYFSRFQVRFGVPYENKSRIKELREQGIEPGGLKGKYFVGGGFPYWMKAYKNPERLLVSCVSVNTQPGIAKSNWYFDNSFKPFPFDDLDPIWKKEPEPFPGHYAIAFENLIAIH